jgi:hypothetical protein
MPHHQIAHLEQSGGQLFDVGVYFRVEVIVIAILPQVLIQIVEGNLISRLVFSVLVTILLHGIVSQMDELVHILRAKLLAARPHVSLTVKPHAIVGVERPDADIKLPAVV